MAGSPWPNAQSVGRFGDITRQAALKSSRHAVSFDITHTTLPSQNPWTAQFNIGRFPVWTLGEKL
jgi:hypothetical protein